MRTLKTLIFAAFIALAGLAPVPVPAQESVVYSQAELDQMLAPIALYPDTVLSHVLIAATYPLEVVQAARWSRNNPGYSGQEAVDMVENQDWDPSVKALVAFPELLDRMDRDIAWTQSLGDAFLAQEGEVTDSIQYLRNQAYNNGQLKSNQQVNVVRETRYIYIEPAQPQVVYVPYYDPRVVYGHWRWAAYPPVYWHHPPGFSVSLGFYWGVGFHIQSSFFFSSFYWPSRHVVVVDHHYHDRYRHHGYRKGHGGYRPAYHMAHYDGARRWQHSPQHRRGVTYRGDVNHDRFRQHDGDRSRNHSEPVRPVRTRDRQRDWADQQRNRYVDNDNTPLRGVRSRDRSVADRPRERNRSGDRDRAIARTDTPTGDRARARTDYRASNRTGNRIGNRGDTGAETVADNRAPDGRQRSRDSNSNRRPAPLVASRDSREPRERTVEQLRKDLGDLGKARRSNPRPDEPQSTRRNRQADTSRFLAAAPQRSRESAAASRRTEPQRRVESRQVEPQRRLESRQAEPQSTQRNRQVEPQRRAETRQAEPQRRATPAREAAPVRQARADRASRPERAASSQRSEPRQVASRSERSEPRQVASRSERSEPQRAKGKSESRNQSRGSRGRERNSRD